MLLLLHVVNISSQEEARNFPLGLPSVASQKMNWCLDIKLVSRINPFHHTFSAKMEAQTINNSPEIVAFAFVDLYYRILQKFIDQAHRFYKEKSVLSWPPHGEIKSVKSSEDINEFIILSHFKDKKVEVINIDSQSSAGGGVLVVVTACLIEQDNSRKNFSQTFFLAPQETGYYVLNDIFRFVGVVESLTLVEEKVDENALVAPLATEGKIEDTIKEVSDNSETKVTTNDQVVQKPSLTSNEKEESIVETALVVQNEAPKISYASMMKQGRSSPPANVRVVADVGLLSTPKKPRDSSPVQALSFSSSGVLKAATASTNAAQDNIYDDFRYKSIYIGGLPTNTTRSDLYAIVKEFGPVDIQDVQLKIYEDGYCVGFVHFQDKISAKKAVQARYIIVKGREVYIRYKRLNKGRGEKANSPSQRGGFHNSGSESRRRPQNSDGHKGESYQQQNYRRRGTNYN